MEFPDLSAAKLISIDIESNDPDLKTKGPGTHRGSYIAGISVATPDGYKEYFPMRHEAGGNLNPDQVLAWAKEQLGRASQPKVGAHLIYDLEFLEHEGVDVKGELHDVQYAEPLIDEHKFNYTLDALGKLYVGEGKDDTEMYKYLAETYGGKPNRDHQACNIWRAPGNIVRAYAISDADLPIKILRKQIPILKEQELYDLYRLECNLLPLYLAMRKHGVRVDIERAEALSRVLGERIEEGQRQIEKICGRRIEVAKAADIAPIFDMYGIAYPTTGKSKAPSFTDEWFASQTHPLAAILNRVRKDTKAKDTFIDGYILGASVDGRLYGQFHPLKEDGGSDTKKGKGDNQRALEQLNPEPGKYTDQG